MNVFEGSRFARTALMMFASLVVYASAVPPAPVEAVEPGRRESILIPDVNNGLSLLRASFGTAGEFRFITPIAPNPHDSNADFDADLLPYLTVTICKVTETGCTVQKTFTSTSSPDRLRIENKLGRFFIANWTTGAGFDNTPVYRISVDVPGETLGSVNLPPSAYRQWGRTWPIKFIVEKDPALRIRLLSAAGLSLSEIADILRSELGICDEELSDLLMSVYPDATAEQVEVVVSGVCQEVEIPTTTKVADVATRNALTFYDSATGRMVFVGETVQLKNLRINDVLVSKPSTAAPFGFLRKVNSIRKDKVGYIIESVQAKLTEAVYRGSLNATGELLPSGAAPASLNKRDEKGERSISPVLNTTIDEGAGFNFQQAIDVTINFDGSQDGVSGTGTVRVQGSVYFNAGYNVGLGIEPCLGVPPACIDRFEAWAGGEQKSKLRVTGTFDGTIQKEKVIAPVPMNPIIFFIGPIPVVLVPKFNVVLGLDGDAHVDFVFDAKSESRLKVGAKWLEGSGWQNISEYTLFNGEVLEADLNADMRLEAYGKVDAKILLYNVVGPGMDASVGAEADVETGRKPFWKVRGHLVTNVKFEAGIDEIVDIGTWTQPVLNFHFRIAESLNAPPVFSNIRDGAIQARVNRSVYVGPDAGLAGKNYDVFDPEGDIPTLSVSAPDGVVSGLNVTYSTPGLKTVKITASDAESATTDLYLGVDVRNLPPTVTITPPSGEVPATGQYWLTATGYDPEDGNLRCSRLTWSSTGVHTKTVLTNDRTCTAVFKFTNPGTHTVTVSATDSQNATVFSNHTVLVTDPPEHPLPEIEPGSFSVQAVSRIRRLGDDQFEIGCLPGAFCEVENGDLIYNGYGGDFIPPLIMRLNASDPSGGPVMVEWYCQTGENFAAITDNGDGSFGCTPIYLTNAPIKVYALIKIPPSGNVENPIVATPSEVRTYYMLQRPN